jgi:cytochrome c
MRNILACATLLFLATGFASAADSKGTPAEAQAMLAKAVKLVETDGEQKALAAFNDPKGAFRDRDLYVFCSGPDRKITAHYSAEMMGVDMTTLKDSDGKPLGPRIAQVAQNGGGSIEYTYKNPVTGKTQTKQSFVQKAGTQVCGVGAYK